MEEFKSLKNKFLKVQSHVVLTPVIDQVIYDLDQDFADCPSFVTSGYRDSNDQLRVIRNYLKSKGLDKKYPNAMTCAVEDKLSNGEYVWQMAWSNLLNLGVIINPCMPAKCLMDYFSKGVNKKGKLIGMTPHATKKAFNIGGGANGPSDELQRIQRGIARGVKGIKDYLLERENNALHINCI